MLDRITSNTYKKNIVPVEQSLKIDPVYIRTQYTLNVTFYPSYAGSMHRRTTAYASPSTNTRTYLKITTAKRSGSVVQVMWSQSSK
jgi:hypothetical protein